VSNPPPDAADKILEAFKPLADAAQAVLDHQWKDTSIGVQAIRATLAWFFAGSEGLPKTTTFDERMTLCRYSEYLVKREWASMTGEEPESYKGRYVLMAAATDDGTAFGYFRESEEAARAIVDRVMAARAAAHKGGAL